MDTRKQINVRVEDDILEAIDNIRRKVTPLPSVSDVVKMAILEKVILNGSNKV